MAPVYAASKAGLVGMVRSLARLLDEQKIQINALAPAVLGRSFNFMDNMKPVAHH
jgi:NAD(P)-dependent dehydrogenase (short-subunit alcohol dehydrogenase family)